MKGFIVEKIQTALNCYLALDPEIMPRLAKLSGRVVTLELQGLGLTLQLVFSADKILINHADFRVADTTIKGTPLSLLQMAMSSGNRNHFFADDISIEGNLELGQAVVGLFDNLEIDWEEYLSKWVGDVPAHQVGRFLHNIIKFKQRTRKIVLENVTEYIHEEIELFPPSEALSDFFNEVDDIRMDVDRVDARIQKIKMYKAPKDLGATE